MNQPSCWVTGTIVADGREVTVAAAATGRIRISGAESDRYSRPRIDLNGDGRFDRETEQVHVGETIQMLERPAAFTVRYQTAFGQPGQGEALLVQPDPAGIRRSIRSFVDHLGRAEHLAIVGAPDRIPFAILESEAYYKTLDIKQELASDAPYADLDDDPSLELAVGRVLVPDLERGSAILATSLAYPRFEGEWVARAAILAPGFAGAESRTSLLWVWPESESLARSIDGGLRAIGVECDTFVRDTVERADVLTAMQHAGWIGHMNHSNETTWGIKPGAHITSADLPELYGSPIVVDTGCSSAGIDRDIPLGNTMPGRFFDLGAVAYVGNTRPASLGTEAAVQQMYNRLIADGATIGQAYRDGRNLLAHLLEHGHMDPEFGTWIFDPAVYERTWLQFYNLNLFGDPALTARRPEVPNQPLLDVRLDETAQPDRHRLTITRHAPERVDPLLILPNAGPGTPREAMLPTAPGLSYGIVPHFYLDRNGLGPIRSPMAVAPGAWVDVELPAHFDGDVNMTVVDGPEWANRGFSIETDPNGPTRLRAYVPLVHTDLETGSGDVLDRVVFDVTTTNSPDPTVSAESATRRHHIQSSPLRATAPARTPYAFVTVTDAAREILTAIEARRYDPWDYGLVGLDFTVANPGSDVLENAECRLILTQGNTVQCSVSELPARLESHRVDVEQAFGCIADFVVNDPLGFLISGEYAVTLEVRSKRQAVDRQSSVLRLVALGDNEADEIVRVVVSKDARIEQVRRRRFGVEEVTHFEWHATPEGDIVTRLLTDDIRYGQPHVINIEYDTNPQNGYRLPSVITIGVPGLLARPFVFRPHYEDPAAQRL
ncbi:MAG: hypothetical protein HND57_14130 [Planctomycetes bacterium]|nr:hypothetical protein [Planctomycetota bacterium]